MRMLSNSALRDRAVTTKHKHSRKFLFVVLIPLLTMMGISVFMFDTPEQEPIMEYVGWDGVTCERVSHKGVTGLPCSYIEEHPGVDVVVQRGAPNDMLDEQRQYDSQQRFEGWRKTPEGVKEREDKDSI